MLFFRFIPRTDCTVNMEEPSDLSVAWDGVMDFFSQTFESTFSRRKEKSSSNQGVAGLSIIIQLEICSDYKDSKKSNW